MTHTTEMLVNVALVTLILVNVVAGVVLIKKTFGGRLGYRFKDRVWSTLDDHGERLAIVENNLEALDPGKGNPVLDRNTGSLAQGVNIAGIRRDEMRRAFRTLTAFEKEIDPDLFSRMVNEFNRIDPDPDFRDFEEGRQVHGFK